MFLNARMLECPASGQFGYRNDLQCRCREQSGTGTKGPQSITGLRCRIPECQFRGGIDLNTCAQLCSVKGLWGRCLSVPDVPTLARDLLLLGSYCCWSPCCCLLTFFSVSAPAGVLTVCHQLYAALPHAPCLPPAHLHGIHAAHAACLTSVPVCLIAANQRRGSTILAWMVILSVYGADTIAIDLSLSALIS
jgi:hypothetical protein